MSTDQILARVEEIEQCYAWASPRSDVSEDIAYLCQQLRVALHDVQRVDYLEARAPERFWGTGRSGGDFMLCSSQHGFRLVRDAIDAACGQELLDADDAALSSPSKAPR